MAKDNNLNLTRDVRIIKKDRLRFTKNSISSTLCYIAILFNVLYYVDLYSRDSIDPSGKTFFYSVTIGLSVVCNLLFLLFTFLASEGVKNYSKLFSIVLIVIGVLQVARVFGLPLMAMNTTLADGTTLINIFEFATMALCLTISSVCCIVAGVVGIIKTLTLEKYKKETGLS